LFNSCQLVKITAVNCLKQQPRRQNYLVLAGIMSVDGLLVFADVFTEWTFVVLSSASLKLFSLSLKLRQNKLGFVPCSLALNLSVKQE
jgi:hypothetical protein